MTVAFDEAKHCGARRSSCDRKAHGAGWGGECDQRGETRHAGAPCTHGKGWGTSHTGTGNCKLHGGASQQGEQHAAKEAAQRALEELGVHVEIDPRRAVLAMVAEAYGNVIFLRVQAGKLGVELVGDVMDADRYGELYATKEEVRAIVRLYGEWSDRVVKYSKVAIDAGIAEARLELERQTVEVIVNVVAKSLDAAHVTPEQREAAVKAAVNELRELEAAVPTGSNN